MVPNGFPRFDINGDGVIRPDEYVYKTYDAGLAPILSDGVVVSITGAFPMSPDATVLDTAGNHKWNGRLYGVNVLLVGGGVEVHKRNRMQDRVHSPYPLATFY